MWSDSATVREWRTAESPTQKTLYQVVQTARGPFAVGSSGVIVTRRDGEWLTVVEHGPATRDNALRGIDVTDDGTRVWFLGGSGALGCYDVETDRKYDYSFPQGKTSTWTGIAVAGDAGSEKALAANGSGTVLPFAIDGFDVDWAAATKPGSGATIAALAAAPDGTGFAVDTAGNAYKTTAEDGWEDIGVVNAQVGFNDIAAGPNGRVYVAGGTGKLYRYDDSYNAWTPIQVGTNALETVAVEERTVLVAGGGGQIYQRTPHDDVPRWDRLHSPTDKTIRDVALGRTDVAVTAGGGIVIRDGTGTERKTPSDGTSPDGDNYEGRGENYDGDSGGE